MKRSRWPSSVLFILTVLLIGASLAVNIFHVYANSTPSRGKLFVLLQGLNTSLQDNTPPTTSFGARNGVAPYLSSAYPGSQFLMYSYTGDNSNGYPAAYQCQDTFTFDTKEDVLKLAKQLGDYLKNQTNMDVYLVGHSFGGLVAYGYLSYLLTQQQITNGDIPGTTGDRLAGIVTLDTPLGGIPDNLFMARVFLTYSYIHQCSALLGRPMPTISDLFSLYKTSKSTPYGGNNSIAKVLFNNNITNEAIATEAITQGIQLLTIGNERDYMYDTAACQQVFGHPVIGTENYLTTQWLSDKGATSGIYGRYFADGVPTCDTFSNLTVNHGLIFIERSVQTALGQFINNESLTALSTAPLA